VNLGVLTCVLPVVVYILLVSHFRSYLVYEFHFLRLRGVRRHIDTDTREECNSGAAPFVVWSFNIQVKTWSQLQKCLVCECNYRVGKVVMLCWLYFAVHHRLIYYDVTQRIGFLRITSAQHHSARIFQLWSYSTQNTRPFYNTNV